MGYLENYWPYASGSSGVNVIGNAVAWPDKIETSPMAHDDSNGNRSGKRDEVPLVSTRSSLGVENEQAIAERDGRN